jgi:hypothetical protein
VPLLIDDTVGNEAEFEPYVQITDASGQDFDSVGGGTWLPPRGTGAEAVFDAPEGLEGTGREHRFRLEVPLSSQQELVAKPGPFVFEFEVPVAEAPTIEVDQQVEAEGIVMTLERVVNSPVLPQAVVCFEPPDAKHLWMPSLYPYRTYDGVRGLVSYVVSFVDSVVKHYTAALLGKREVWIWCVAHSLKRVLMHHHNM